MNFGNIQGLVNGTEQVVYDYEVPALDSYTKLLVHFDGADAATAYLAESGQTVTFAGTAQLDTAQKEFGTASLLLDGNSDYVTVPDSADWNMGSGDFTIDFWFRGNTTPTGYLFHHSTDGSNRVYFSFNGSGGGSFVLETGGTADSMSISGVTLTSGVWYHIAIVRNGTAWNLYVDGTSRGSTTSSRSFGDFSSAFYIGRHSSSAEGYVDGWIDEFRISKGIARWTADFTPPTSAYTGGLASSISTGNILNGDEDGWYTIIVRSVSAVNSGSGIQINSDTGANYGYRGIQASNTTGSNYSGTGNAYLNFTYAGAAGGVGFGVARLYAKSGSVRLMNSLDAAGISTTTVGWLNSVGSVWNNTADNITSLTLIGGAANMFAVGTRMIVLKSNNFTNGTPTGSITCPSIRGAWKRVGTYTVTGSASAQIDFTSLKGNDAVIYRLCGQYISGSTGPGYELGYIRFNDDAGTNYGQQYVYAENTTVVANRSTSANQIVTGNLNVAYPTKPNLCEQFIFAKSGFVRPAIMRGTDSCSGTTIQSMSSLGGVWNNTTDEITKISIKALQGGNYGIGSWFELYGLYPNG